MVRRPAPGPIDPPAERRGRAWDRWCYEMVRRRGYAARFVAQRAGESEPRVIHAVMREERRLATWLAR